MSTHSAILRVDIDRAVRILLAGGKVQTAAAEVGVTPSWLYHQIAARGVAYSWTTAEERRLIAELRAGRAQIVRNDCAPAAARLAQRMEAALAEYTRGLSSGT